MQNIPLNSIPKINQAKRMAWQKKSSKLQFPLQRNYGVEKKLKLVPFKIMLPSRWRCGPTVAGRSHFRAFWDESHIRLLPASHRAAAAARQINNFKEIAQTTMATLRGERGRLLQLATPQSMQQAKPKPCTSYKVVYISIGELHEWAWSGWRKKSTSC